MDALDLGTLKSGSLGLNNKQILNIIKTHTSKTVIADYLKWFKARARISHGPLQDEPEYCAGKGSVIKIRSMGFGVSEFNRLGAIKFVDSITVDFSEAMKYYELNCGQKATGIYGITFAMNDSDYKLYVYDKNNVLLATYDGTTGNTINEDGAVKVQVESASGFLTFISYYYMTNFNKYATQVQD